MTPDQAARVRIVQRYAAAHPHFTLQTQNRKAA